MTTPQNLGNELFLLMVSLTRLKSRERVVEVFTEALSHLFEDLQFEFSTSRETSVPHFLELVTSKQRLGRIIVHGPWETVASDTVALVQNAVVMLALILENLSQAEELAQQSDRLKQDVAKRNAEVVRANEELHREMQERIRAQEILRQKTEELERYFDSSLDLLCIADTDGYFLRVNHEWERTLGYPVPDIEGRRFLDFVHPDDVEATLVVMSQLKAQAEVRNFENRYRCKDGTYRWIEWRSRPEGELIYAIARDVTDRKIAEDELRRSEAKYRFLAEHASDVLWTMDLNLRTTFVSPSIQKVLGFTPEERMLQDVEDQLTPESLEFVRQKLVEELTIEREQGVQEGKSVLLDLDYWHKNGSIVCLQSVVAFIRDENGTPIGIYGISRDVTALKRAQEALRESEERYRRMVETANEGIWSMDEHLNITFVNRKMATMLGYSPEEMLGRPVHTFIFEEDLSDHQERVERRKRGESDFYERKFKCKDGQEAWMLVSAAPLLDKDGTFRGSFAMFTDITERKIAEEALKVGEEKYRLLFDNSPVGT
ncbi:MAG: PAS domain S-box protein [Thermodesulfobacteriota bacterium]